MNMPNAKHLALNGPARSIRFALGFTLMELMVSIAILLVIILSVGVMFSGASKAVGMSQATMEEMAGVRAIQQLIEHDLRGLDPNGFLVIRSRVLNSNTASLPNPTLPNLRYIDISPHYDQLSFLAQGTFANPTGSDTPNPFTDSTTTTAAHIWWGHAIVEKTGANANPILPPFPSYVPPDQSAVYPQNTLPTGVIYSGGLKVTKESDFMLARHLTLLVPGVADASDHVMPAGQNVMAYSSLDGTTNGAKITAELDGAPAHITSSRFAVAAQTPSQVMRYVKDAWTHGPAYPEADVLTYRFRALDSVYDTEVGNFVNGYFRSTPAVMRGVSSFKVEWTDGSTYTSGAFDGQLKWFGPGNVNGTAVFGERTNTANGDDYDVTFSYMNRQYWPKALRITIHVANERIGGRDFVQVVNLPQ